MTEVSNSIFDLDNRTSHLFAIYSERVRWIAQKSKNLDIQILDDAELLYRIHVVLRLGKGDNIILFENQYNILCTILNVDPKKSVTIEIHEIKNNKTLKPLVIWLLPILKKEAFEESIYVLTELGAEKIQPMVTEKSYRHWTGQKEMERCKKIMISAAEQSKQFILPELLPINTFEGVLNNFGQLNNVKKIFFDKNGSRLEEVIEALKFDPTLSIVACSGPEGDLSFKEKVLLQNHNFTFCKLTETTLRAPQALTIGFGAIRSLVRT